MKVSRRNVLAGAAAVPLAGLASWRWSYHGGAVLVHDPMLAAGREFAAVTLVDGRQSLALEGDRIRFARELFASRPLLVRGVTRQADAVLLEDVAGEEGYSRVALEVRGNAIDWALAPRIVWA
ncbi:MAG: hypothetical protein JY451_04165 [Erythrobacter sp.]|nr:MAG: hypothetical protein JY451_04165 [Erythrobacter sp.]